MTKATTDSKTKRYRLKSMVLARILAEISVLLILVTLPAILAVTGHFQSSPMTAKFLVLALSLISGLILPAYAFITFMVAVDKHGVTAMSLANHQRCEFHQMRRLSRRSNWNWVRYVVEHQHGELSFPIWLVNCDELLETIKKQLPAGSGLPNPFRKFSQDKISLLFQCIQALLGIGLVVVFWIFFKELNGEKFTNQTDLAIVLGFCVVITLIFIWRSIVVFLIPKSVELTPSGIIIDTMAFSRKVGWQNVLSLKPAVPLLPEGFMLKTARGSFLIGNGMDAADELVSAIQSKLPPDPKLLTAPDKSASKPAPPAPLNLSANEQNQIDIYEKNSLEESSEETFLATTTEEAPENGNSADETKAVQDTEMKTASTEPEAANSNAPSKTSSPSEKTTSGKKADRKFRKRKNKKKP